MGKGGSVKLVKAKKMVRKKCVALFVSAAANTLSILLSIKQKKEWTEEDSKNLVAVSVYPVKKNDEALKRKRLKPASLQNFPAFTLYLLQEKGAHDNGGGCGRSEPGMRKYNELERNLPQHSTRNY
jgi:hypothetical protein